MNTQTSLSRTVLIPLCALAVPMGLAAQDAHKTTQHHHYKLIDTGTLGGSNAGEFGAPVDGGLQFSRSGR